jgi:membrane-associated protease RseP (regulator of RpoE activity)
MLAAVLLACTGAVYAGVPQDSPENGPAGLLRIDAAPASYLGVNIRDIDDHSAKMLGLKSTQGVEVIAVDHDAPAGKAGIHLRDVIVTVDGKAVTSAKQFRETMRVLPPGREVNLNILRLGKPLNFAITLADRAKMQRQAFLQHFVVPMPEVGNSFSNAVAQQNVFGDDNDADADNRAQVLLFAHPFRIGAELDPIGPQLAAFFGVKDGTGMLVKSVQQDGPAAAAGLQAGDVVLKLNDESIASALDWMRAMQSAQGKPLQLTIVRNKHVEVITINPPKTQAKLEWPSPCDPSDFKFDDSKFNSEMDAVQADLKDNPAFSKEAMQKIMADAQASMPDITVLRGHIDDQLKQSGVFENGQLSPEFQQQMQDEMDQANQLMKDAMPQGPWHLLQPY